MSLDLLVCPDLLLNTSYPIQRFAQGQPARLPVSPELSKPHVLPPMSS